MPRGKEAVFGSEQAESADRQKQSVLLVSVAIMTVELPVGQLSRSEEVWSYLNEEQVAVARNGVVGRNGFRIGTCSKESWSDLRNVLQRLTGSALKSQQITALPGRGFPIVVGRNQPAQTIFTYKEDGSLSGRDYPAGDNLLLFVFTLNPEDRSKLMVSGMPQIRTLKEKDKLIKTRSGLSLVREPERFAFSEMVFQSMIPEEDLLVIGPGAASSNPSGLGHHFLTHQRDGMLFETLLIVVPRVYVQELKSRPQ